MSDESFNDAEEEFRELGRALKEQGSTTLKGKKGSPENLPKEARNLVEAEYAEFDEEEDDEEAPRQD
eukprot:gene6667-12222_t